MHRNLNFIYTKNLDDRERGNFLRLEEKLFLGNNFDAEGDDNVRDKDERRNTLP